MAKTSAALSLKKAENPTQAVIPTALNYFDVGFVFVAKTDRTAVLGWKTPLTGIVALAVPKGMMVDALTPTEVDGRWVLVDEVDMDDALVAAFGNERNTEAAKMRPALVSLLAQHLGEFGLRVSA
jgi:hypothetical protein